MLTDAQNRRLVRAASLQALTDPVTGLGNHRALTGDLRDALDTTPPARRVLLALYDLNGFKDYNDRFGHPAGDALLARLGTRLRDVAAPAARAYRMGGDEFCVLAVVDAGVEHGLLLARAHSRADGAGRGLHGQRGGRARRRAERGDDGVRGAARRRRAHVRVQAQRAELVAAAGGRRARRGRPGARARLALDDDRIARLAERAARELGMDEERRRARPPCRAAARRRQARGPEEILAKPGPLDAAELEFVRTPHARGRAHRRRRARAGAGRAARPLEPRAVGRRRVPGRSRGRGDPARRARRVRVRRVRGDDERPGLAPAIGDADALAELARNAGTQFDPAVVRALARALAREDDAPALAA